MLPLQLKPALAEGLLSPSDIDTAVNRTLAVRFVTGQFDSPRLNPWADLPISTVNGRMSRLLARNVVQKGERHACTHHAAPSVMPCSCAADHLQVHEHALWS
jgi:hypothetical protein